MPEPPTPAAPYDIVVIAASSGGVQAIGTLLADMPGDFPLPVVVVQHRAPSDGSVLDLVLGRRTAMRVKQVEEGEVPQPGVVYVANPRLHLTLGGDHRFRSVDGRRIRHVLSSANPLFESVARTYGPRVIAVVLTGYDSDATDGVQAVKAAGGTVIAQDRKTSEVFGMPGSAIATGAVDYVLPLREIAPALRQLTTATADEP